jgi:thiosulfate reductase cytochrome b subunit
MSSQAEQPEAGADTSGHKRWVRILHWVLTASILTLVVTGVFILMVHPRLYWGEVGNDLTPAFIELPISRNHRHGGWEQPQPFFENTAGPVSASRKFEIFNQNGWARSLHFLAGWFLVVPGMLYLLAGALGGHLRWHILPGKEDLAPGNVLREVRDHLRLRIRPGSGGPSYGVLQKCAYTFIIFVAAPLIALTGLTMAPAVTAAFPFLLRLFGGYQSARTIHFFTFVAIVLFVLVHFVMVSKSGFRRQIRGMTIGE